MRGREYTEGVNIGILEVKSENIEISVGKEVNIGFSE